MSNTRVFAVLALSFLACQPRQAASNGPASPELAPDTVVAKIDGQPVTAREVDARVKGQLARADAEHHEKVHELREGALGELIDSRLVEKKAKAEGVTPEALIAREVDKDLAEPTDAELREVYQKATEAGQELPPFDNIRDDVYKFVKDQKRKDKLDAFHADLRSKAKVETMLPDPPKVRVEVPTTGPAIGPADAPVTIVEFSDYECPFCHRAEPTVKRILETYKGKVRLVYREFPLPGHAHAQKAAEAALCALDQNKYWEMHDKLFEVDDLEVASLKGYAKDLGLDSGKFDGCLDSSEKKEAVRASTKVGEDAGVSGTPAFFINGVLLSGALPFDKFKEVIDAELAAKM